ncbi:flagellar hook assembly protein FlgD [Pseudoduganella sp. OTU4001]|uniref:flagellar hook assembly protein FlgD n=1 Tax=Pseudoduganella sp. OTU4001 TaxID=3043854 RepID=UPI00313C4AB1
MAVTATDTSAGVPAALLNTMNPKAKTQTGVEAEQDKFMTLLITQLKNQDPLNPLDNAQVTSQLAQLNTVTGINKMNETLASLKTDYQSTQNLAATNLINRGVLVDGNKLQLSDGKSLFGVELGSYADKVQVDIVASGGKVVQTVTLDNVEPGVLPLTWDGKLPDGTTAANNQYTLNITARSGGKELKDAKTLELGTVASISTGAGGVKLNIPSVGQVTMDAIKQVL